MAQKEGVLVSTVCASELTPAIRVLSPILPQGAPEDVLKDPVTGQHRPIAEVDAAVIQVLRDANAWEFVQKLGADSPFFFFFVFFFFFFFFLFFFFFCFFFFFYHLLFAPSLSWQIIVLHT
jgi:ABC-type multidrug transport system permease subunit